MVTKKGNTNGAKKVLECGSTHTDTACTFFEWVEQQQSETSSATKLEKCVSTTMLPSLYYPPHLPFLWMTYVHVNLKQYLIYHVIQCRLQDTTLILLYAFMDVYDEVGN